MAFLIHHADTFRTAPLEYLAAGAITPKVGMALVVTNGKLAVCTGASKPAYIAVIDCDEALADGAVIPVTRVHEDTVFAATSEADISAVKVGDKLTIGTDGLTVTATTGGCAEVVSADAAAKALLVRFVDAD